MTYDVTASLQDAISSTTCAQGGNSLFKDTIAFLRATNLFGDHLNYEKG